MPVDSDIAPASLHGFDPAASKHTIQLPNLCDTLPAVHQELYDIDGPQHTRDTKKALRHRKPQFVSRLRDITLVSPDDSLKPYNPVWMPIKNFVRELVGQTVAISRNCYDDSEPRRELHASSIATIVQIGAEGGYLLELQDFSVRAWIFRERYDILKKRTNMQDVIDELKELDPAHRQWKQLAQQSPK